VLATLGGMVFLVALMLAVPAPGLLQPEDSNAAKNRWLLTVAGCGRHRGSRPGT
jgi:hypothetical protein